MGGAHADLLLHLLQARSTQFHQGTVEPEQCAQVSVEAPWRRLVVPEVEASLVGHGAATRYFSGCCSHVSESLRDTPCSPPGGEAARAGGPSRGYGILSRPGLPGLGFPGRFSALLPSSLLSQDCGQTVGFTHFSLSFPYVCIYLFIFDAGDEARATSYWALALGCTRLCFHPGMSEITSSRFV